MIANTIGAFTGVIVLLVIAMVLLLSIICIIRRRKKRDKLISMGRTGLNNVTYEGKFVFDKVIEAKIYLWLKYNSLNIISYAMFCHAHTHAHLISINLRSGIFSRLFRSGTKNTRRISNELGIKI